MKLHRFASHTPEEKRRLSNLGHIVEGAIFGAVGILALMDKIGIGNWAATAWPVLILVAGVLLLFFIYPRHPISDWGAIWRDGQQRQHTIMAAAVGIAGGAELLGRNSSFWVYVWPAALVLIGIMFLTHEQHATSAAATKAVRLHRTLGITIIIAGLLRGGDIITEANLPAVLWPLALLLAALQLIIYREPEGAYEMEHEGRHHQG